jgi:hypothetical protein
MRFVAGQWVDHDGEPVEILDPETVYNGESGPAAKPEEQADPRETKASAKDPRKAKGAQ